MKIYDSMIASEVLEQLPSRRSGRRVGELARSLRLSPRVIHDTLEELVDEGLVERISSPDEDVPVYARASRVDAVGTSSEMLASG